MRRVLVGYASRFGSTREVATRIADRLRGRGHEATVCAVDTATALDGYDAVVLGSRVYDGRDGDNRSWPDIDAWADAIASALDTRIVTETPATSTHAHQGADGSASSG